MTYWGNHFINYINDSSLCCTHETKCMLTVTEKSKIKENAKKWFYEAKGKLFKI